MSSDHERDAAKMTLLPPARLHLAADSPAVQLACGLHHTGETAAAAGTY